MPPVPNRNTSVSKRVQLRLKPLRQARGWSQQELADRLIKHGLLTYQTKIAKMEAGSQRVVTVDEAAAIAAVLGISVGELIEGECLTCKGAPPAGFMCQSCGAEADA